MRSNTASRHQKQPPPKTIVCKFSIRDSMLSRAESSVRAMKRLSVNHSADNSRAQNRFLSSILRRSENMIKPETRFHAALFQYLLFAFITGILISALPLAGHAQVVIAQISDTHLGEPQAPHAFDNLRRTVDMVNARHPDAVIVSGDVGENYEQWLIARGILK